MAGGPETVLENHLEDHEGVGDTSATNRNNLGQRGRTTTSSAAFLTRVPQSRETWGERVAVWLWLLGALFVCYLGDGHRPLHVVLKHHAHIRTFWWNSFLALISGVMVLFMYASFWLPWTGKVSPGQDYEEVAPWVSPVASGMTFIAGLCFQVAIWPVWGWLTVPLSVILGMGILMAVILIPTGRGGNVGNTGSTGSGGNPVTTRRSRRGKSQ